MHPIKRACQILGGQRVLAEKLGVTPGRVGHWVAGDRVLADYCPIIERETAGAVRCEELRPDVDWGYLRATNSPVKQAA
jgi:DNA-binding transcriptional regulator YdaS (Cro superfamily)